MTGAQQPTPERLARAVEQLINQVSHWTPARWSAPGAGPSTPAERVHALVQRMAELAAAAEGEPARAVPRLDSDLALPDQLKVVTVDLLTATPPPQALAEALEAVRDVRTAL